MPSEEEFIRSEYKEIIFYIFFTIFLSVSFPWMVGLGGRAFSESFIAGQPLQFGSYLVSSVLYLPFLLATIFCIIYPIGKLVSMKQGEHPATKPNPSWFRIFTVSYLYAPESNGLLWYLSEQAGKTGKNNFMRCSLNPLRVLVVSIIVYGIFGILLVANPQIAISGIPAQQITEISEISFGAFIPAVTENGSLTFILCFLMGIVAYICAKYKFGKNGFYAMSIGVSILMGILWMSYHLIIYSSNDANLIATFLFGFLGSLITILTGVWLFWTIWHVMNNSFLVLERMITLKEDIYIVTIIFLIVITLIWIGIEMLNKKIRKKMQPDLSIPAG
jgi:hypothetical protein